MRSFSDVIDAIGGPPSFAEAVGIPDSHARTMKARDSIPPGYWPKTVAAALAKGRFDISLETLAAIAEAKTQREPERVAS
jgi:hypothetical protein